MAGEQLVIYIEEHPEQKDINTSGNKEVMLWAESKRFISLHRFAGHTFYTEEDEAIALMWRQKVEEV